MRQGSGLWVSLNQLTSCSSTFLHLFFEFFDVDEMSWIERKRGVVAVAFVRAETAIGDHFPAAFHGGRIPETREIPVIVAQIGDRIQNLAARNRPLIIDNRACGSGPAL